MFYLEIYAKFPKVDGEKEQILILEKHFQNSAKICKMLDYFCERLRKSFAGY